LDTCINDAGYITPESNSGVLISRAVAPTKKSEPTTIKVAYDPTDAQQLELVKQMEASTANDKNVRVVSVVWEGAQLEEVIGQHCVFLIDVKGNFLGGMDKETAYRFKGILRTAKTLVWVTRYNTAKDRSPDYALVQGLVRTLATENDDCKVFSVALEEATGSRTAATNILKVTNAHLSAKDEPEDEYVEINGTLHVPRVTKADDMAAQVHATEHKVTLPWGQLQQPSLTIGTVGRLNTLVFEQEIVSTEPLKAEEVLVEIRAVGLSNRDLLVAQGHVHDDTFGSEFAAVVKKSGSGNSFKVGDNVFGIAKGAMSSERRVNASQLQKMPQGMDFTEAATYPVAFTTAYYSLVHCARLRHGETILVHGAATELGQSVIQLAQQHNCEVFITVDSSEQAIALQEKYNIPRSHTFSSQTSDFASAVRRLTQGRGVDVAVTSRAGEIARDSWDCLATFGRLIGIGGNNTLTNFPAGKSRMFVDVNIQELAQTPEFAAVFDEVAKLMASNKLTLDTSIRVLGLNDVKTAFRQLANADHSGRMAIKMDKDEVIEMVLAANTNSLYDANSSYLLAGGFGGIGQDLSRWMIQNGCKNLILPARSRVEGTGSEREKFLNELRAMGCDVRAPLCDITDKKALQKTIADLKDSMPPIKGAIQSAMTLRDSSFQNMTMEDWHAGLSPKLVGSWNLHETLPNDLDFFIMFSSTLGIMGSFGQANYTSGNTYEDALAIHRVRHGHRAHAVALGMVVGVGMVAEDEGIAALLKARGMLEEVTPEDIYDLVRFCCNPSHACVGGQVITPLSLPKDFHAMGIIEPAGFERPIYSHLQILPSRHAAALENSADAKKLPSHSLPSATSLAEATNIITEAIQAQLSSLLVVSKDDIDPKKPIHKYGVDSLVAVEMKNWFMKGVGADVGTADILGHSGISELAAKVATRSKFVKDELKA
jgi:NADPH:quinone reductase-like Zn-dependent oxidoreductase/NADP-dependent 3-hydroxy acid dehydrogenase YdfG/aryl carrier-like protein